MKFDKKIIAPRINIEEDFDEDLIRKVKNDLNYRIKFLLETTIIHGIDTSKLKEIRGVRSGSNFTNLD